jgi:hypothetical protein
MPADAHEPVSISYLVELGVDLAHDVKLIVGTHWHDDHIRGFTQIVRRCRRARVALSMAFTERDFLSAMFLIEPRSMMRRSGMREFWELWNYLREEKRPPRFASADQLLWRRSNGLPAEAVALSPSDQDVAIALQRLRDLIDEAARTGPLEFIQSLDPNAASVVTWIRVGPLVVLMGGDLESAVDPGRGWLAVLTTDAWQGSESTVFKVPHHGSDNAYEPRIWAEMLAGDPVAVVTPFVFMATRLPTAAQRAVIRGHTSRAYLTAPADVGSAAHTYTSVVADMVDAATRSFGTLEQRPGHLRVRADVDSGGTWSVDLFGPAAALPS